MNFGGTGTSSVCHDKTRCSCPYTCISCIILQKLVIIMYCTVNIPGIYITHLPINIKSETLNPLQASVMVIVQEVFSSFGTRGHTPFLHTGPNPGFILGLATTELLPRISIHHSAGDVLSVHDAPIGSVKITGCLDQIVEHLGTWVVVHPVRRGYSSSGVCIRFNAMRVPLSWRSRRDVLYAGVEEACYG